MFPSSLPVQKDVAHWANLASQRPENRWRKTGPAAAWIEYPSTSSSPAAGIGGIFLGGMAGRIKTFEIIAMEAP
jgi:hypothetical protein